VVTIPYELDEDEIEQRKVILDMNGMHDNEHITEEE
jgi:hypothetical protein